MSLTLYIFCSSYIWALKTKMYGLAARILVLATGSSSTVLLYVRTDHKDC